MSAANDPEASDYMDIVVRAYEMGKEAAYAEKLVWEKRAEMEKRRYGTDGRAHFGDHREEDYKGGSVAWKFAEKEAGS